MLRSGRSPWIALALALAACRTASGGGAGAVTTPPAEAYERASDFKGEWLGESAGSFGILKISSLGTLRYYGSFESEDGALRYVANMQQRTALPPGDDRPAAANLLTFTWQDGRGGLGQGWVLINKEDSALTGVIYFGEGAANSAALSFVRVDE
ncbi:MAG TPA: hypothetical protein PKW35_15955 [Nannocystaceae bacterium]|nr:hypothetical protein [Nannocystaceae bacterium]